MNSINKKKANKEQRKLEKKVGEMGEKQRQKMSGRRKEWWKKDKLTKKESILAQNLPKKKWKEIKNPEKLEWKEIKEKLTEKIGQNKKEKLPKWFTEKEKLGKKESFVAQNFPKEMWKKIGDPKEKSMDQLKEIYIEQEKKKLDKIKEQQKKKKEG